MAQTGFTPIQIYRSSTASAAPTSGNLVAGELAINTADGKLFYLDNLNAVQVIGWKLVPTTAGGTGLSSYTTGDTLYSSATNTLAKLPIGSTGQVLTVASGLPAWSSLPAQVYPGAGIPKSTGTAWGTSYGVTGTGSVVLSASPTITGNVQIGNGSSVVNIDGSGVSINVANAGVTQIGAPSNGGITLLNDDEVDINTQVFIVTGFSTTLDTNITLPNVSANQVLLTDANKVVITQPITGSGNAVFNNTPTITTPLIFTPSIANGALIQNTTQAIDIGTTQSTGAITVGGTGATGAITIGQSTGAQAINIGNGAASTSTINIGGTGASTGAITLGRSTGSQTISIGSGATGSTVTSGGTRTINIGTTSLGTGVSNVSIGKNSTSVNHTTNIYGRYININASTTLSLVTGGALSIGQNLAQTTILVVDLAGLTGVVTGSRAFVTDASVPVFGALVSGGGSTPVPVYFDGTSWRVG
jgi:hypothetical protein